MNPMNFVDPMGTESQRSKFVRETVDKYNKLVKWGAITRSEANKQLALDIKAWEDEHSGPAEQVETESTILKDFFVGCLNTIKKINNYLPGNAKKAAHEAIDERNARLQAKNGELLEEETWNIQTEIDGKKTSATGREALGDMASDATNELQWSAASGIIGTVNKARKVRKIKGGPEFPDLKYHARKHSDLHPNAYYNKAVEHMSPGKYGKLFKVRHNGQTKMVYLTRTGKDSFIFTSTNKSRRIIFTHMEGVDKDYLINKGIKLPEGF